MCPGPRPPTAQGQELLRHAIIGRAVDLVSGPGGLAAFLRTRLAGARLAGPSLPLDVGHSATSRPRSAARSSCEISTAGGPADTSTNHTLVGRARCRLVRRACRYIIYGWCRRVVSSALEGYLDLNH